VSEPKTLVAFTTKVDSFAAVALPDSVPSAASFSPAGSVPLSTE
jgi:hypothetical protein